MTYRGYEFNGTGGTAEYLRFWCNYDINNYWLADRLLVLVRVTSQDDYSDLLLYCQPLGWVAYDLDANGYCIIDLTDIIRTYRVTSVAIGYGQAPIPQGEEGYVITGAAKGLINPAGVVIPIRDDDDAVCRISAPSVMLASFGGNATIFEMWSYSDGWFRSGSIIEVPSDNEYEYARSVEISDDAEAVLFNHLADRVRAVKFQPLMCERNYVGVEWVSFTGVTRRHTFEIVRSEIENGDTIELANLFNEWTEIKGRTDGFVLRLENLDRYDLWYYSDIITSSRVRVTINGNTWYDVQVDSNGYTLPDSDAGELSTLNIPIKFKRYDAVVM